MPFEHNNKFGRGGRRPGSGRPSNEKKAIERVGAELVRKWLEDHLKPVLDTYLALATGTAVGKRKFTIDPATTRHYVERFVSPAPRQSPSTLRKPSRISTNRFGKRIRKNRRARLTTNLWNRAME